MVLIFLTPVTILGCNDAARQIWSRSTERNRQIHMQTNSALCLRLT